MISKIRVGIILLIIIFGVLIYNTIIENGVETPNIKKGVLDLNGYNFEKDEIIELTGEWEIYPGEKLDENELKTMENRIYKIDIQHLKDIKKKIGTFHLKILMPKKNMKLAFKVPRIANSYELMLDGKKVIKYEEDYRGSFNFIEFENKNKEIEVIIYTQYNNMDHFGLFSPIEFSKESILRKEELQRVKINYFIIGAILLTGFYHLILFLFRHKSLSNLYFAIFALLMGIRMLISFDIGFDFGFKSEIIIKLEYLTFYLGVGVFPLYVGALYKDEISKIVNKVVVIISLIVSAMVLVFSEEIYEVTLKYYQVFAILVGCYIVSIMIKLFLKKEKGSLLFFIAFLSMFIAMINDILINNNIISGIPLFTKGLFLFLVMQSIYLSREFAMTLNREEKLLDELQELNRSLENQVKERTVELKEKNAELSKKAKIDGLTGLYNHRTTYLKIEEIIKKAKKDEEFKFSILMCDVDNFKNINDNYGHQIGDMVLKEISSKLKNSIRDFDIAGRYGGEEFLIIFFKIGIDTAKKTSDRIREEIGEINLEGVDFNITISGGVTEYQIGDTPKSLIKRADGGLYIVKNSGKNRIEKR